MSPWPEEDRFSGFPIKRQKVRECSTPSVSTSKIDLPPILTADVS